MRKRLMVLIGTVAFGAFTSSVHAWDHTGHMTTASIIAKVILINSELPEMVGKLNT